MDKRVIPAWQQLAAVVGVAWLGWLVLMPSLRAPRDIEYRRICRSNLQQLGLALQNYHDTFGRFPASTNGDPAHPYSWRVEIINYIDSAPVRYQFKGQFAWDAPENLDWAQRSVGPMQCPSQEPKHNTNGWFYTAFGGIVGPDMFFRDGGGIRSQNITDGLSNTIALVEAHGQRIVWTEPRDVVMADEPLAVNHDKAHPGTRPGVASSNHKGGAHVLMADGSLRFVSDKVDPDVLKAALTINGGEPPPEF